MDYRTAGKTNGYSMMMLFGLQAAPCYRGQVLIINAEWPEMFRLMRGQGLIQVAKL